MNDYVFHATANLSRAVLEDVFMRVDQHLRVTLESIQSIVNFETPEERKQTILSEYIGSVGRWETKYFMAMAVLKITNVFLIRLAKRIYLSLGHHSEITHHMFSGTYLCPVPPACQ